MQPTLTPEKFLDILKDKPKVIFCFDYDGTLVELATKDIVKEGLIKDEQASIINQLASLRESCKVAIVTGRALKNLKSKIQNKFDSRIMLYGTHGAELGVESENTEYTEHIAKIKEVLELEENLEIEEKQISITVHYLNHPDPKNLLLRLNNLAESYRDVFRVQTGRDFFEFLPKHVHKGLAVHDLNNKFPEYYLVYFGDDLTDNYAFQVINSLNGLSCQITDRIKDHVAGYQINMVSDLYDLICLYLGK